MQSRFASATLVVAAVLLAGVALINGGPVYYPDTAAYLLDADRVAHLKAPFAVRPVFYGLAIWPLHWETFFLPAVLMQGLLVAHVIYLTARACGCALTSRESLGVVAALVVLTPVSFHVSHLLPDIFVGVLILALFLLGFCRENLDRLEICYLVALGTAAASFHLTAIPVGVALFALASAVAMVSRRRLVAPLLVLAPTVLAIGLSLAFSVAVFGVATLTPKNPPHFLARILADGPGREFLRATCPRSGFMLCEYQERLTSVEDDFLWRLLPSIPAADGYRIKAEQRAVVQGTIAMFPLPVIDHMLGNMVRQLMTFQSETQVSQAEWNEFQAGGTKLARSLEHSLQGKRVFEAPRLDAVNAFHAGVAAVSVLASLVLTGLAAQAGLFRPVALASAVFTGVLANALACGAFGGVFARYEGRVIWLIPLTVCVSALALMRGRSELQQGTMVRPAI